jgi:hypothetical protein
MLESFGSTVIPEKLFALGALFACLLFYKLNWGTLELYGVAICQLFSKNHRRVSILK